MSEEDKEDLFKADGMKRERDRGGKRGSFVERSWRRRRPPASPGVWCLKVYDIISGPDRWQGSGVSPAAGGSPLSPLTERCVCVCVCTSVRVFVYAMGRETMPMQGAIEAELRSLRRDTEE
jgi:hypothetical protein